MVGVDRDRRLQRPLHRSPRPATRAALSVSGAAAATRATKVHVHSSSAACARAAGTALAAAEGPGEASDPPVACGGPAMLAPSARRFWWSSFVPGRRWGISARGCVRCTSIRLKSCRRERHTSALSAAGAGKADSVAEPRPRGTNVLRRLVSRCIERSAEASRRARRAKTWRRGCHFSPLPHGHSPMP